MTGTNTPTRKTHLECVWAMKNSSIDCARDECVAAKEEKYCCCVCVCCTVFDATHPCGVVCFKWVCVGGFSVKGTPGPVPIPVAKFDCADGTAIVGLWESKTPPTHITSYLHNVCVGCVGSSNRGASTPHTFLCPR